MAHPPTRRARLSPPGHPRESMTIGDAPDPFDLLAPLPPKKPPVAEAAELPERAPVVPETAPSSSMLQHAEAKLAGEHATPSGGGAAGDDVPATGAIAEMIRDAVGA